MRLQMSSARAHCHTMALYTGLPLSRYQAMAVSRWLLMPMAAMSAGFTPDFSISCPISSMRLR